MLQNLKSEEKLIKLEVEERKDLVLAILDQLYQATLDTFLVVFNNIVCFIIYSFHVIDECVF